MKKVLLGILLFLIVVEVYSANWWESYKLVTKDSIYNVIGLQDKEDGPGLEYFGMLELCLQIDSATHPIATVIEDESDIKKILESTKRPTNNWTKYGYKFVITFPTKPSKYNLPKTGKISLYINNTLRQNLIDEIKIGSKYYLLFTISSFNTLTMETIGIVNEFVDVETAKKMKLIK